jgi:hypothetical protein
MQNRIRRGLDGERDKTRARRIQGGQDARPVPDRACVRLSATATSAAAVSMFIFSGSAVARTLSTRLVVVVPAIVPTTFPAKMPAATIMRTSSVTGRQVAVFVTGRTMAVPVIVVVPEPTQHRAPEPHARRSSRRPPRSRVGGTREQQQQNCCADETSLHDCSFVGDHSTLSTAARRVLFRARKGAMPAG